MGKKVHTVVLDGALDIFNGATELYVCTAEPTDRANAISLALNNAVALAAGDFVKAAGDVSGRKSTVAAKSVPLAFAGTGTHVVTCTGAELRGCTTMPATAGNVGDQINLSSWAFEVRQAA